MKAGWPWPHVGTGAHVPYGQHLPLYETGCLVRCRAWGCINHVYTVCSMQWLNVRRWEALHVHSWHNHWPSRLVIVACACLRLPCAMLSLRRHFSTSCEILSFCFAVLVRIRFSATGLCFIHEGGLAMAMCRYRRTCAIWAPFALM